VEILFSESRGEKPPPPLLPPLLPCPVRPWQGERAAFRPCPAVTSPASGAISGQSGDTLFTGHTGT